MQQEKKVIDKKYIQKGISYSDYKKLIDDLLKEHKTTGAEQSEELYEYAKLNAARMNRIEKTTVLKEEIIAALKEINTVQHWFLLTEGWCGDAAQSVPVIAKMAAENDNIQLHILLRDENLDLMDQYLQNGKSRSIPKLIVTNQNLQEIFSWGPRPVAAQYVYDQLKNEGADFDLMKITLQKWYHQDATQNIQNEIVSFILQKIHV